jgi:uncharacterized protein YerC
MNQEQTERLIEALQSIAASLKSMEENGVTAFLPSLLTVNAMVSTPDGVQVTAMPDEHFVQVFNPKNHATGKTKPFITEAH